MTTPLSQPLAIGQASATPLTPQAVGDRVTALSQAHPWMPADMTTTLASAPTSDSDMHLIADNIKTTLAKAWNGFTEATDDNVLHKQPSAGLALTRMLSSSLGPLPVAAEDLTAVQKNLQAQGFGGGLAANGEWGADWNTAYNGWSQHQVSRQLAGDETGSVSTGSAGHHIWDDLLPSHAVNAIVGYAKSIPGDARDLAANIVGSSVNTVTDPQSWGFSESKQHQEQSKGAAAARAVESLLGNPNSTQTVTKEINHPTASLVQDVGTVLALAPVAGRASAAGKTLVGSFGESALTEDAAQSGGVVSKSLFAREAGHEAAIRAPGVLAKSLAGGLDSDTISGLGDTARADARRGILNTNAVRNIPLLGQVGPVVGRLADADGLYYKARTLLATPYQIPIVRAAGAVGERTMLTGAALQGAAQAEQGLGVGNTTTNDVLNTNFTNTVDRNLDRLTGDPSGHPFTQAVNALGFVLHGPLGDTANSTAIGDAVQASQTATAHAFGQYGVEGAWERAISKATGKRTTITDLHKAFGSEELADRFLTMKTAEIAAAHHAQSAVQDPLGDYEGLEWGTDGYREAVGQEADRVWASPDLHQVALRGVTADKLELENRFAADAIHAGLDPRNYNPNQITDIETAPSLDSYVSNGKKWMDAGAEVTKAIRDGHAAELFGGQGQAAIRAAQDNFDYGLGSENPVRLSSQTRRQYVHEVTTLKDRVSRGVDKARIQIGKQITDAQSGSNIEDTNRLKAAQRTKQQFEAAVTEGRLDKVPAIMRNSNTPRTSSDVWSQLGQDHARFRDLVKQGLGPEEPYSLPQILEQGVDPDNLYSRINGEPRISDVPAGGSEWIRNNFDQSGGTLGIGRVGTKSIQQAQADITRLEQKAVEAVQGGDLDRTNAALERMRDYAFSELGITARTLGFQDDPSALADILRGHASNLASDAFLPPDASPQARAFVNKLAGLGYKPMFGSHIGHIWDGSLPPIEDLKGAVSYRRRFTDALGLSVESVTSRTRAQDSQIRVLREVQKATENPKFKGAARSTAETYLQVLRDDKILEPDLKLPEKLVYTATRHAGMHPGIKQLVREGATPEDAEKEYREGLAQVLQLRDIPRKKAVEALTTPHEGVGPNGPWEWPGLDRPSANLVINAVRKGYADRPNYLLGLSSIEDWARGGFTIGGKLAARYPGSELIQRTANLPNELINLRNRLRFTLSPFFDARRITKTNYKMSLDGVTPVFDPLQHMVKDGTFRRAHDFLDSIVGDPETAGFDDADRYLHSQSVWGKYNARHFEAYYAWQKKAQGADDSEIRSGIRRVFEYGSTREDGRTPLEASINTLFFPFSFEKTLLRNTGMYFLDHPQQALLATGIVNAYDQANKHDQISNWTAEHLPILEDFQKLNAFAHGLSLGQPGGINAPLLNLMLPQHWHPSAYSQTNLKKFLPVVNDFGELMTDLHEQADIGRNAAENAFDYAVTAGKPRSPFDPYRTTLTPWAQREHAAVMRNQFISALTPVLDHNVHAGDASQEYTWPDGIGLPPKIVGQPVTRTSIGYLVQRWYPAYDPAYSQQYAVQQEDAANTAIANLTVKNPTQGRELGVLQKLTNSYSEKINDGSYTTAEAVTMSNQFRALAVHAAETEPGFLDYYNAHMRWVWGTIESVGGRP